MKCCCYGGQRPSEVEESMLAPPKMQAPSLGLSGRPEVSESALQARRGLSILLMMILSVLAVGILAQDIYTQRPYGTTLATVTAFLFLFALGLLGWIRRSSNLLCSFVFGMAVGVMWAGAYGCVKFYQKDYYWGWWALGLFPVLVAITALAISGWDAYRSLGVYKKVQDSTNDLE
mmetsp:Transcript_73962/g.154160  ORF Transcript_73962/g.154160 Transcript_73962/m.154160 type:complete len:175 (-) Transcript_73962:42-566(-)|eukprot:CAMPEP_0206584310 /NCGR_PEP_ID=MMETSP0325_2-20121206/35639_1 /ASSEMBLY_ACC=CAM_ASM_000347 /TAXON_ID=2866 /ORGANISM="Crypthecodinium cohnii, Strain Seligo" /LENGTH=174 /DNA_ID=CAMNT_0054091429 /DNA_START=258 /DNA_END=782 /DNA_ORIENTATION=+